MKKLFIALLFSTALFSCKKEQKTGVEQIPPAAFEKEMIDNPGQVIDVRTPKEFTSGHIESAKNLHIYDQDFGARLDSLDKNETVYVYCKAGGRSAEAVETLEQKGFKHIVELEGGLDAWNGAGKPVTE
ncbi:rhodanese-like domain-containing protein [Flavobacterium sp. RHBU_24]|uniref:rhodanese-like domain-containing protein n=1 Tax=Flavobacterium sp. RHBU_24 TaxID=3391185 RepID=UPI003984F9BB